MQCTQFNRRFHELLDRREQPEEDLELEQHATQCKPCRQLMRGQQLISRSLFTTEMPHVDSACSSELLATINELSIQAVSVAADRSKRTGHWATLVAAAACLALGIWLLAPREDPQSEIVETDAPPSRQFSHEVTPGTETDVELPDPIRELLSWSAGPNMGTGSMLLASTSSRLMKFPFPHTAVGRPVQQLWQASSPAGLSTDKIRHELRPLIRPVHSVLDTLRESFRNPRHDSLETTPDRSRREWKSPFWASGGHRSWGLPA